MIDSQSSHAKAPDSRNPVLITEKVLPNNYFKNTTPVIVIMGVSGCGKTTLNQELHKKLGWDMAEADDFHPQANIDKMTKGIPLTDVDRWPWLDKIRLWIDKHMEHNTPGTVTCSALKKSYRDKLWVPGVIFVYLNGNFHFIKERLSQRQEHFMNPLLLGSQFDTLEPPNKNETHITIDVTLQAPPEIAAQAVIDTLHLQ